MKNLKSIIAPLLIVLFFSNTIFAATVTSFEVTPVYHEKMFVLNVKAQGQGIVTIQILGKEGDVIFSDKLESVSVFEKRFNLESMEEGNYILKIEDEFTITSQPLYLDNKKVEVNDELKELIRKPYVKINNLNKRLDINWVMPKKGNYKMVIQNAEGSFSFEDTIKDKVAIHQTYNLSKIPEGKYFLTIKSNQQTFYKTIELK